MGALVQVIDQVPTLGWVLFAALAVVALWRVFNVLYVKPRDFRIDSLEEELKRLKAAPKERESGGEATPAAPARQLGTHVPTKPAEPNSHEIVPPNEGDPLAEGLRSLALPVPHISC